MVGLGEIVTVGLFAAALRMATPLIFAALGGMFSERAGIVNIGLEGMMLIGAFVGVVGSYFTGNPWLGVLTALAAGGLLGLLHAVLCVKFIGNQIVSGVAINLFGLGFTAFMCAAIWGDRGASPSVAGLEEISIPLVKDIPVVGGIFGTHAPLVYLALIAVVISYMILFRTSIGLKIRAIGANPAAADTAGVPVFKIKYICVAVGGMLAALGGVFLSLAHVTFYSWGMTAGRGFIALAVMIFGKWMPFGVLGAGLLFGLTDALQMRLQGLGVAPPQIFLMIPYLVAIAVVAGAVGRATPPSNYKPYIRE